MTFDLNEVDIANQLNETTVDPAWAFIKKDLKQIW